MKKEGFISTTLVYTFLILFLFLMLSVLTAYTQKNKFLDAIREKITEELSVYVGATCDNINSGGKCNVFNSGTLAFEMVEDNNCGFPDNENSTFVNNEVPGINFSQMSSDTNGKGLYYTADPTKTEDINEDGIGEKVYYFRGDIQNNNVLFAGFCWKILRTNEDGSVRIIYNGKYENGTCPSGEDVKINNVNSVFNSKDDNEKHNEFIFNDNSGQSTIKRTLDTWYFSSGLSDYETFLEDAPYCGSKSSPTLGYYDFTFYDAANRLTTISNITKNENANPILKCDDINHKYTVESGKWNGNAKLAYKVGLITADEIYFAGGIYSPSESSTNNFLYTASPYWTMTPFYGGASTAALFVMTEEGTLGRMNAVGSAGVLPVISLKNDAVVFGGNGSYTKPYQISTK